MIKYLEKNSNKHYDQIIKKTNSNKHYDQISRKQTAINTMIKYLENKQQ